MVKEAIRGTDGKVLKVPNKERGFLYFVDSDGTVTRAKMSHGGARLSPEEVKRRQMEKQRKHEAFVKRVEANRMKKIAKLKEAQARADAAEAKRKAKIAELS